MRYECKQLSAKCYKKYVNNVESSVLSDAKEFWKFIKNKKDNNSNIPSNMHWNDLIAESGTEISNLFANHFKETYTTSIPHGVDGHRKINDQDVNLSAFEANFDQVFKQLLSLNPKKGAGPDGLPNMILKNCAVGLCEPISHIFSKSLELGTFPTAWKLSYVSPIHKNGPRSEVTNYRPVCLQSALAKLFEKVILPQLTSAFKNVISPKQHGFVGGRSTTSNLFIYVNYILDAMNNGTPVHAIYTDFSKAFDKVDHDILISKLKEYGVDGNALNWLRSYLAGRRLQVRVDGHLSEEYDATTGVPQGSHLGPILFIIFVNDIGHGFQSEYQLFADDLKIYRMVTSVLDSHILQDDIDKLQDWCLRNKLDLNIKKCAVMSFSRSQVRTPTDYKLNNQQIQEVEEIKDLGITIDNKLTFNKHIERITLKAYRILGLITRTGRDFSNTYSLISLFSAMVLPILEYGTVIWSPFTDTSINKLERVQHKFCKNLLYRNRTRMGINSTEDVRRVYKINDLVARRKVADLTFFFKSFNGQIDAPDVRSSFELIPTGQNLRHTRILKTTKTNKSYVINGPKDRISNLVNILHKDIDFFHGSYPNFRYCIRKSLLKY